jgi:hypothetical protein
MPENLWPVKCPQLPEVCDHHPFLLTDDPAYFRKASADPAASVVLASAIPIRSSAPGELAPKPLHIPQCPKCQRYAVHFYRFPLPTEVETAYRRELEMRGIDVDRAILEGTPLPKIDYRTMRIPKPSWRFITIINFVGYLRSHPSEAYRRSICSAIRRAGFAVLPPDLG